MASPRRAGDARRRSSADTVRARRHRPQGHADAPPPGHRRNAKQLETRQAPAIGNHLALALPARGSPSPFCLTVLVGREFLRELDWDRVLRGTIFSTMPPIVSSPKRQGCHVEQQRIAAAGQASAACRAAPSATTSSGSMSSSGGLPIIPATAARTRGTRVEPPTRTTLDLAGGHPCIGQHMPGNVDRARHGPRSCPRKRDDPAYGTTARRRSRAGRRPGRDRERLLLHLPRQRQRRLDGCLVDPIAQAVGAPLAQASARRRRGRNRRRPAPCRHPSPAPGTRPFEPQQEKSKVPPPRS